MICEKTRLRFQFTKRHLNSKLATIHHPGETMKELIK